LKTQAQETRTRQYGAVRVKIGQCGTEGLSVVQKRYTDPARGHDGEQEGEQDGEAHSTKN
jgi:hypothetical protein